MPTPTVLTIGNFDGVHLGHQAIVQEARTLADQQCGWVVVLAFEPHPASTLRPGSEPPRLTSANRRVELLKQAGADEVHLIRPTRALLSQSPDQFIDHLSQNWQPSAIVEGDDFRFGKRRAGDVNHLRRRGADHGYELKTVSAVKVRLNDGAVVRVGSSLIRRLIGRGRMTEAGYGLGGRAHELEAPVVRGQQQGREIGFPTINLDQAALKPFIIPADGVYAGYAQLPSTDQPCLAALSVGVKPTFDQSMLTVEAHLLDLDLPLESELYGQTVRLTFARWLRDQYAYPDLPSLQTQLNRDVQATRRLAQRGFLNVSRRAGASPAPATG